MQKLSFFILTLAFTLLGLGAFSRAEQPVNLTQTHTMTITLSGGAEVPGPGDTDGSGTVNFTMNHDKGELCYEITVKDIQAPTAAHIHTGMQGKAGPPKVTLAKAADGTWKGCVNADKELLNDMMKNPGSYYVNVHNQEFPNGALRGQLGK